MSDDPAESPDKNWGPAEGEIFVPETFDPATDLGTAASVARATRSPQPWHRPRKHYVRRHQWAASLTELIADQQVRGELSYLGLPGDEFLDIRYLANGPIQESGTTLRFLGFNANHDSGEGHSEDPAAVKVSRLSLLEEIRNHPHVNVDSRVQPDDLRRISSDKSPAHAAASAAKPFDIINFDLTQSLFAMRAGEESYPMALRQLLGIQVAADRDWLLWVTMRVDRASTRIEDVQELHRYVCERFDECRYVLDEWTPSDFDARSPHEVDVDSCTDRDFTSIVFLGFALWLSQLAKSPREHRMRVTSSIAYRAGRDLTAAPNMLSLVVRFSPQPVLPFDPTHITDMVPEQVRRPDDCERLEQLMQRLLATSDLDETLVNDPGKRDELVQETAQLLAEVGIDPEVYLDWVDQFSS